MSKANNILIMFSRLIYETKMISFGNRDCRSREEKKKKKCLCISERIKKAHELTQLPLGITEY